jgi:hypothetical protein
VADGVDITAGTGTTILTDDCTTGHAQVVKLAISTDGSATYIPADATNGLLTNNAAAIADDAAFTVATSKVVPVGFLADDASADAADEGDAVAARVTLDRKQVVMLGESGANLVRGGGSKTDTTDQSIMSAVASKYNYLHWVAVYNASSTNTYVNVKDGSTVVAVLPLPAYGGAVFNLPVPIRSTVNTAFNLAAGASVTTAYLYGGGYVGY